MSLSTAFTSVLNLWITKSVNTGDRALDQAVLLFLTISLSVIITKLCTEYTQYYNAIVYIIWKVWKNPKELKGVPILQHSQIDLANTHKFNNRQIRFKTTQKLPIIDMITPVYMTLRNVYYIQGEYTGFEFIGIIYGPRTREFDSCFTEISKALKANCLNSEDTDKTLFIKSIDFKTSQPIVIGNISPRKTFDTLFYDEKDKLLRVLKSFQSDTMYPASISMDNKLGILLYGPPGTGKTGTISAIANMLRRDLIIVNCAALTTTRSFDFILQCAKAQTPQPILVFDEIDCILNVLVNPNRTTPVQDKQDVQTKWAELLAVAEGEERKEILKMIRESKQPGAETPLDLGYVLSKLDGLEDNTDRLIIATTNHPDKINPALLRPGRFDLKLCLNNCSEQMLVDILGSFFRCTEAEKKAIRVAAIPEFKHSPLHVINTALTCMTLEKTLETLKH
jgi:hypothetical protein